MASQSIVVENLGKSYGEFLALDGISFSVEPGEIVGFLGPNGAGKTTTMKIITCFMAANRGSATVAGFDVYEQSEDARKKIGYLPESVPLYEEMMVFDYLKFIAEVRGIPAEKRRERIKKVVELTGLGPMVTKNIGQLSKGYRQRVGLAQAIIHEPEVLVLDEPTSGLDPNQIIEIRDLIKEIGKEKTVILSTHILQEVAAVCDRIIVIHEGKIVADGTVAELSRQITEKQHGLIVATQRDTKTELESIDGVGRVVALDESSGVHRYRLEAVDVDAVRTLVLDAVKDDLVELRPHTASLEDVFRALTGDDPVKLTENENETTEEKPDASNKDWAPKEEE